MKTDTYVKKYLPKQVEPYRWLVLIHGMGEHHGRYAPLIREMVKSGVAVIGVDLPGHGKGSGPRGHIPSIEDVVWAIKEHMPPPDRNIFAFGHSIGGLVVVRMLQLVPYAFDRVILSSPGMLVKTGSLWQQLMAEFFATFLPGVSLPLLPVEKFGRQAKQDWEGDSTLHRRITGGTFLEMKRQVAEAWLSLDRIDTPCLLMVGDKDPFIDHGLADRLVGMWRGCHKRVYDAYHDILTDPTVSQQAMEDIFNFLGIIRSGVAGETAGGTHQI